MSRWPGVDEWLFSMRTFAAAMLAFYIALSIGLDKPYWAWRQSMSLHNR